MRVRWSPEEIARVDALIRDRLVAADDADLFPGRSLNSLRHIASKRRDALKIVAYPARKELAVEVRHEQDGAAACDALHRATVQMCIRRGITLPGLSPAHTRAIAVNLGIGA